MRISYTLYKFSVFATILDIASSIGIAFGVIGFVSELFDGSFIQSIPFLFLVSAFIGAKMLAAAINNNTVNKKLKKSIEDPKLISMIRASSVAAYSMYKNNPSEAMANFVKIHNPFTAMRISEINNDSITEEQAIKMLRDYDAIDTDGQNISANTDLSYSNTMFKVNNVLTEREQLEADYKKAIKSVKTSKTALFISLFLLAIFAIAFAVTKIIPLIAFGSFCFYALIISLFMFLSKRKKLKILEEQLGPRVEFIK